MNLQKPHKEQAEQMPIQSVTSYPALKQQI